MKQTGEQKEIEASCHWTDQNGVDLKVIFQTDGSVLLQTDNYEPFLLSAELLDGIVEYLDGVRQLLSPPSMIGVSA